MGSELPRFAIRRVLSMLFVLFAVSVLVFLIFNVIPGGDPAVRMAGKTKTETQVEAIREEWGFDEPLYVQYGTMMKKLVTGDMVSYSTEVSVSEEIRRGLPSTLSLVIGAAIIWMAFAIALGVYSALRAGRISDRLLTVLALIGVSMPVFWLGALLSYYLGYKAGIFPSGDYVPFFDSPAEWLWHLILPWFTLSILFIGVYSRILRSDILETMGEDYVRTARAKGLSGRRVMVKHVLRTSMIPLITLWGLDFGAVIGGGALLTETVFDLQGVGQYAAEAVNDLDLPPIMAVTLFGAFFVVVFNTLVDIAYAALDPRIRLEGRSKT